MGKRIFVLMYLLISFIVMKAQVMVRDLDFDTGLGPNNVVYSSLMQADGKIIISGSFTTYNGNASNRILRIMPNGQVDTSFVTGIGANSHIYSSLLQTDGKIIVAGQFTSYNNKVRNRIARLQPNGNLDTLFQLGAGANGNILSMGLQSDGKIIIVGSFTTYDGQSRNRVARLFPDGSLDTTFQTGSGANQYIWSCAIQADGKILIGGLFSMYQGVSRNRIARLLTDGTIDASFDPGSGILSQVASNAKVSGIILQPNQDIILCGKFQTYNQLDRINIVRIKPDGSIDQTFDSGIGANDWIWNAALQSDGKIFITGYFTTYQGHAVSYFSRLFSNGLLDTTCNVQLSLNNMPRVISIQADQKVLLGGHFTMMNTDSIRYLTRLEKSFPLSEGFKNFVGEKIGDEVILSWKYESFVPNAYFEIESSLDGITFKTLINGRIKKSDDAKQVYKVYDQRPFSARNYYRVKISSEEKLHDYSEVVSVEGGYEVIQLFPNPVANTLHLQFGNVAKRGMIQILDDEGKSVMRQKRVQNQEEDLDISNLTEGHYYLEYTDSNHLEKIPFVKMNK